MKCILPFLTKYRKDIICISFISTLCIMLALVFGPYFTNAIVDLGREVLFPELLLQGKLLYKDIFNLFGPLGYQLNAIWYFLFGVKISTLQHVGMFCSLFILCILYAIARLFFKPYLSCAVSLVVMACSIFSVGLFNFIYPYSYSIVYANLFVLISAYCFLIALRNEKKRTLLFALAYFFAGASVSSKYEYLPYVVLLIAYSNFIYKSSIKHFALYLISLLFVPFLSYGVLFLQGVTVNDLYENIIKTSNYISSESMKLFYSTASGTYFSFRMFKNFEITSITLSIAFVIFMYLTFDKLAKSDKIDVSKREYVTFLLGLLFFGNLQTYALFLFFPYFLYAILAYLIYKKLQEKKFCLQNDLYFAFLLISIFCGLKTLFILNIYGYGSYAFGLEYIAIVVFCIEYIPKFTSLFKVEDIKNFFLVYSLLVFVLTSVPLYNYIKDRKDHEVKSYKGSVYDYKPLASATQELLNYIEMNVGYDESLLVIPEGAMVNYMTDRDMKIYSFYCLLPQHIDAFGIREILKNLKRAEIDYLILSERKYPEYGGTLFACEKGVLSDTQEYYKMGKNERILCSFILSNYKKVEDVGEEFKYSIYKINKKFRVR